MLPGRARSRPAPDRSGAGPTRRGEPPAGVSAASGPATRVGTGKPVLVLSWQEQLKSSVNTALLAYDAGTEMGTGFSPDNEAEDPHMPISMIMCDSMAFCEAGEDIKPVAKITVTKMM